MYRDTVGEYRWRLKHENGNVIADSGEGYRKAVDCRHGIMIITSLPGTTPVVDMTTQYAEPELENSERW
ncbi:YegP family protein [Microvirga pudoricolor]|uniref:YegP family protein n=1 Tax=Microvirga pudoricolor TaxID=2778729 RepID=UPI003898D91B